MPLPMAHSIFVMKKRIYLAVFIHSFANLSVRPLSFFAECAYALGILFAFFPTWRPLRPFICSPARLVPTSISPSRAGFHDN